MGAKCIQGDDVNGSEGFSEAASGAGPQSPGAFSIAPRGSDYASPPERLSSSNHSEAAQSGDSFYTAQVEHLHFVSTRS